MPLTLLYHPDCLLHDTGPGHPERRVRLETIVSHLMGTDLWGTMHHERPRAATLEDVHRVHPVDHVWRIMERIRTGETLLDDGDTRVGLRSWDAALLAAGASLTGVDRACGPEKGHVFAAVRPPGHHAETKRVMGFCLVNNIAIGARYAQKRYGVERIAVVDWDVHHGNGTQEIFWSESDVLYISMHQFPLWPGTGARSETGTGKGEGYTVNCPIAPGSEEKTYLQEFQNVILPKLREYRPQLLMISAGFDAHRADPLAYIQLESSSFGVFTHMLLEELSSSLEAGVVSLLEGGYDPDALATSVEEHLRAFGGT